MDRKELDTLRSIDELRAYQTEVKARMTSINLEFEGLPFSDSARDEFGDLKGQNDNIDDRVRELEARKRALANLESRDGNRERERDDPFGGSGSRGTSTERDIFDLSTVSADMRNPERAGQILRDRAMRALEISTFPHIKDQDRARSHVANLLDNFDTPLGEIARRVLTTGKPSYRSGFMKWLAGREAAWSVEERAAMAEGAGATGGYAIVYTLDPTFVPTSNRAVNPFRAVGSVETIAGTNEWRGVTAGAVTASRTPEATEATDGSPTLTQPALTVSKVQAFVPISIELSQDLPAIQAQLAMLIQDAKDVEEAQSFTHGNGTGVNPEGIVTRLLADGATVPAGGTAAFAASDLDGLEDGLGARFRPNASFVANRSLYNKVRAFDTNGGALMWLGYPNPLQNGLANRVDGALELRLKGYPAYEDSEMVSALTTGNLIMILGDFRYFKIIDRIGLDIEIIPHLFGAANRFPTGQRGVYAYWRNTARCLSSAAFKALVTS